MTYDHDDGYCTCPWHVEQRRQVAGHDEIHAHADVDWTGPNVVLGED
jgi:hypothetical protein